VFLWHPEITINVNSGMRRLILITIGNIECFCSKSNAVS
jgi:hypothetical protein